MINLSELKESRVEVPPRIVLYASGGFGKSTFASLAPKPIFMDIENGTHNIKTTRFKTKSYDDAVDLISSLLKQEHDFKTLVIDSIDWLERIIIDEQCKIKGVEAIEDIGYNNGYEAIIRKFRRILMGLDKLQAKGMYIIVLAHESLVKVEPPTGQPYTLKAPKLYGKTLKSDNNLDILIEWSDILLYGMREDITKSVDVGFGKTKEKVVAKNDRVLHTMDGVGFKAKSRYALPAKLDFPKDKAWEVFYNALIESIGE